jgi:hypothetical protein
VFGGHPNDASKVVHVVASWRVKPLDYSELAAIVESTTSGRVGDPRIVGAGYRLQNEARIGKAHGGLTFADVEGDHRLMGFLGPMNPGSSGRVGWDRLARI